MNDLGARAELANGVGHSVIEARTHSQNDVAVMHSHVRFIETMHAEHPKELSIGRRICAKTH